jgi:hypothetical protein
MDLDGAIIHNEGFEGVGPEIENTVSQKGALPLTSCP